MLAPFCACAAALPSSTDAAKAATGVFRHVPFPFFDLS